MSLTLIKLTNTIEEFRKLDSEMQAQTMLAFIYIARMDNGGSPASVKEVGEHLGLTSASASRNIAVLSKWSRHNKPGHDLVEAIENPEFRSQKLIRLTAKGKRVIKTLEDLNASKKER